MKFEFKRLVQPNSCCNAIMQMPPSRSKSIDGSTNKKAQRYNKIYRVAGLSEGYVCFYLGCENHNVQAGNS